MSAGRAKKRSGLPTVAIIATGGTIAQKNDPNTGVSMPAISGEGLIAAAPGLTDIANLRVREFSNIDSSWMTLERWSALSRFVDDALADPEVVGAVVTHGTDTMAEGAFFLDLTLKSDKPVAFTGAMRNASELSPDGPGNLMNAVLQVCSSQAKGWGVTVSMNQYIHAARDVRKTQSANVQTFDSGERGCLGYVAGGQVFRVNERMAPRFAFSLPDRLPDVPLLYYYPGDDGRFVRHAVATGAKGLAIAGVGAGNVNPPVFEAIREAMGAGVAVVIGAGTYYGGVLPIYGDVGGGATLREAGALTAGDLAPGKARILLALALTAARTSADLKTWFP